MDKASREVAEREDLKQKVSALDELFYATKQYRTGSSYNELLQFCVRFRQYAPYNAFLMHMQRPGATYVATPGHWLREFERTVKEGSNAIVILAPMSPVLFLYDVADTDGRALPREMIQPFQASGTLGAKVYDRTVANSARDHVVVEDRHFGSTLAGRVYLGPKNRYVNFPDKTLKPAKFAVDLNGSHDQPTRYATLVHELAHIHCGHLGTDADGWWPDAQHLDKQCREFEAESVTFLVCTRAGINPGSQRYLAGYLKKSGEIPQISLERVMKAAGYIESLGQRALPMRPPKKESVRKPSKPGSLSVPQ